METRVQRWGNSLAVRIPKVFAAQLSLDSDSIIDLRIEGRTLVAERVVRTASCPVLTVRSHEREFVLPDALQKV